GLNFQNMLRRIIGLIAVIISFHSFGQIPTSPDLSMVQGTYLGVSSLQGTEVDFSHTGIAPEYYEVQNFKERYRVSPVERNLFPKLDPLWNPNSAPVKNYSKAPVGSIVQNFAGISYTNVNPPDPCVAAGPNHVIQMVNGGGGAVYKIFDKSGNALTGNVNFDNLFSGYSGLGDPIVIYDQLADRWMLSEFSSSGNKLLIAISLTNDPTGSFHTYVFDAINFPDYPKYAVWPDAFYCTANENTSSIYAFERDSMLIGSPARMIRQSVSNLSGFGFQTLTPVNFEGTDLPTTPTSASFWRHVDDEAHYPSTADPFSDYVEYWQFVPNFNSLNNSVFTGSLKITVSEFDSDLNGYFAFSAISQPNSSVKLDPLREVFMNRMAYRNFGLYETIVACHVTDVDGNDRAGMRWYEFRKTDSTDWVLHQEGTYSPSADSRWMGAIEINSNGSICMAYSVSSTSIYPSLRFTGRNVNDPAGVMTLPEQSIVEGSAANNANRYGDYAAMTIDPSNDSTFWFTGEYNPSSSWRTRVAHLSLSDTCNGLTGVSTTFGDFTCPGEINGSIQVQGIRGTSTNYMYSLDSSLFQSNSIFNGLTPGAHTIRINDGKCIAYLPVSIIGPDTFRVIDSVKQITCNNMNNGRIEVLVVGGSGDISYSLDSVNWTTNALYTNLDSGIYTVYVKDDSNCTIDIPPIEIVNPELFEVTYDITNPTATSTLDAAILFQPTGGTLPHRFSLDDVNYQADSLFTGLISGTYWVYSRDANDCFATDRINVNLLSINKVLEAQDFVIFPNPSTGIFKIALGIEISKNEVDITIRDVTGKQILARNIPANSQSTNIDFDLTSYSKGSYFITIQYGSELVSTKVILE
ncbi:MAG: hypothetical protein ACI8SA_001006, partial [Dokdonia sp.]